MLSIKTQHGVMLDYSCPGRVTSKALSVSSSTESPPVGVTPDPLPPPLVPEMPAVLLRFGQLRGETSDFATRRNSGDLCPIENLAAYLCPTKRTPTWTKECSSGGRGHLRHRAKATRCLHNLLQLALLFLAGYLVCSVHISGIVGHKIRVY